MSEAIHQRLSRIRKQKSMTAKEVAKVIGVPASTYREWEYGKGLKVPPFQKLSQVLAISVTELITGEKPELSWALEALTEIEVKVHKLKGEIASLI